MWIRLGCCHWKRNVFFDKHSQQFSTSNSQKPDPVRKETMQMPSTSFGHAVIDVSHDELLRQYGSLYYITPRNFRHRKTNQFILKMCASAKWRFGTKSDLEDWARKERRKRCVVLQVFGDPEEMKEETAYYKDQCLMYKLGNAQKTFSDIEALKSKHPHGLPDQILKQKEEKLAHYLEELEQIHQNGAESQIGIQRSLDAVKGKDGRKEEDPFWTSQVKQAEKPMGIINQVLSSVQILTVEGQASTLRDKEASRKKTLNKKTSQKRSAKATSVLAFGCEKEEEIQSDCSRHWQTLTEQYH